MGAVHLVVLLLHPTAQSLCICVPSGFCLPYPAALDPQSWAWGFPRMVPDLTWSCRSFPGAGGWVLLVPWLQARLGGMGCSSSQLCPVLPQYLEVLRSQQNRPAKCLTVLWALGQAGFSDLHEGLKGESCEQRCGIPSWDCRCTSSPAGSAQGWDKVGIPRGAVLPGRTGSVLLRSSAVQLP